MSDWYKVTARVIDKKGECAAKHEVGDEYAVGGDVPALICPRALIILFPYIMSMQSGGSFPWEKDKDKVSVPCGDPTNTVTFEIRRTV